jgi:hypothetical protein
MENKRARIIRVKSKGAEPNGYYRVSIYHERWCGHPDRLRTVTEFQMDSTKATSKDIIHDVIHCPTSIVLLLYTDTNIINLIISTWWAVIYRRFLAAVTISLEFHHPNLTRSAGVCVHKKNKTEWNDDEVEYYNLIFIRRKFTWFRKLKKILFIFSNLLVFSHAFSETLW